MRLSTVDKKILNLIQEDIPLVSTPFEEIAKKVGITEKELLKKIRALKRKHIIRSYSAGLNHRLLGFKSTLIGLRLDQRRLAEIVEKVIDFPEVTHCYQREGEFNLWVVFVYKDGEFEGFIKRMIHEVGKDNVLNLKTKRQYKLNTRLKI